MEGGRRERVMFNEILFKFAEQNVNVCRAYIENAERVRVCLFYRKLSNNIAHLRYLSLTL